MQFSSHLPFPSALQGRVLPVPQNLHALSSFFVRMMHHQQITRFIRWCTSILNHWCIHEGLEVCTNVGDLFTPYVEVVKGNLCYSTGTLLLEGPFHKIPQHVIMNSWHTHVLLDWLPHFEEYEDFAAECIYLKLVDLSKIDFPVSLQRSKLVTLGNDESWILINRILVGRVIVVIAGVHDARIVTFIFASCRGKLIVVFWSSATLYTKTVVVIVLLVLLSYSMTGGATTRICIVSTMMTRRAASNIILITVNAWVVCNCCTDPEVFVGSEGLVILLWLCIIFLQQIVNKPFAEDNIHKKKYGTSPSWSNCCWCDTTLFHSVETLKSSCKCLPDLKFTQGPHVYDAQVFAESSEVIDYEAVQINNPVFMINTYRNQLCNKLIHSKCFSHFVRIYLYAMTKSFLSWSVTHSSLGGKVLTIFFSSNGGAVPRSPP